MSQLQQLKQAVDACAQSAKSTGGNLAQFDRMFSQQTQQVQQTIGGSTQRKDAEVIQALESAAKQVRAAAQALQRASQVASQYGQSL